MSVPSPSSPSADIFTETWKNAGYIWPNIELNPTSTEQGPNHIVANFSFMNNPVNFRNLANNIKNNAILSVKSVNGKLELDYFDYETMGLKGHKLSDKEKNVYVRNYLGFSGPEINPSRHVDVVTLLIGSPKPFGNPPFIGICYDSCNNNSNISHAMGASNPNRVLCEKSRSKLGVKIAFFPEKADKNVQNPSGFILYHGGAMFDDKGVFLGFNGNGKLLMKPVNGFNLFVAEFQKDDIKADPKNMMYQYNTTGDLTGYASGNIKWNLKSSNVFPPIEESFLESLSSGDNFCVNLDLGSVTVPNDTNDDKASKCSKMYYTVSPLDQEMFGRSEIDKLFNSAIDKGIVVAQVDRKIEFIKKENFAEKGDEQDKCTLYKFKCKVTEDGVFCIIEVLVSGTQLRRIRIYKFYTQGKQVDEHDKKEGLFFTMYDDGKIKSVSIVQQLRTNELYGMLYTKPDDETAKATSKKLMPIDASDKMVKAYEKVKTKDGPEVSKLSERCRLFDDSTRRSFASSINAASACYKLFFGGSDEGGGVVGVFLKQLSTPHGVGSGVDISGITKNLSHDVTVVTTKLNTNLTRILDLVEDVEQSKRVDVKSLFPIQKIERPGDADVDDAEANAAAPTNVDDAPTNVDATGAAAEANAAHNVDATGPHADATGPHAANVDATGPHADAANVDATGPHADADTNNPEETSEERSMRLKSLIRPKEISDAHSNQLPPGWIQLKDPVSGKVYYDNTETGSTQWERPVVPDTTVSVEPQSGADPIAPVLASPPKPLPPGWTEQVENGVTYYVYTKRNLKLTDRPEYVGNSVKIVVDGKKQWFVHVGGRRRGTNKKRHHQRRGNSNTHRRLTRKVKASRRVIHRVGGGRGGKIYKKTKKHGRGGRGGRRRTIKKYHRR